MFIKNLKIILRVYPVSLDQIPSFEGILSIYDKTLEAMTALGKIQLPPIVFRLTYYPAQYLICSSLSEKNQYRSRVNLGLIL